MELIKKIAPIDSLQPPYSMLHRQAEEEVLSYCDKNNIGVVAYSPMQKGLLTGKFSTERLASLPDDDHRKKSSEFQEPQFSLTMDLVAKLQKIAEQNNMTVAQLAISWVLRRGEVTAAIVGARNPKQIKETAPAADYEINAEDIEKIETLLTQWQEKVYGKQ
jgi:aryl-alcohol dehydrogenase-like predicted oxidoreductase